MELPSYFVDFLQAIRPSDDTRTHFIAAHKKLREALSQDPSLKELIVSQFLQGSYRRSTALCPTERARPDVDVVLVTRLDPTRCTPDQALNQFTPFLRRHYPDQWQRQGRSLGITDVKEDVDLDLVITAHPSESDIAVLKNGRWVADETLEEERAAEMAQDPEWKLSPLQVPDREAESWQKSHPLAQLAWTRKKNRDTGGHFVNVVKGIKWWKKGQNKLPKHPKSYPLERIIGECCPDGIKSVAEGITRTFEIAKDRFSIYAMSKNIPVLSAPGVPGQNVLARLDIDAFSRFYNAVCAAADLARNALDEQNRTHSAELWRELLGEEFPIDLNGFSTPQGPAVLPNRRFA